jgi:hypothetical protein
MIIMVVVVVVVVVLVKASKYFGKFLAKCRVWWPEVWGFVYSGALTF